MTQPEIYDAMVTILKCGGLALIASAILVIYAVLTADDYPNDDGETM